MHSATALATESATVFKKTQNYHLTQMNIGDNEPPSMARWIVVPGIYHDFNEIVGAEVSFIRSIFGLVIGLENNGAKYFEAEVVVGPISMGIGPRWAHDRVSPQTTIALPFFFIFPYWRWQDSGDSQHDQHQEFGIMLKYPFGVGHGATQAKRIMDNDMI